MSEWRQILEQSILTLARFIPGKAVWNLRRLCAVVTTAIQLVVEHVLTEQTYWFSVPQLGWQFHLIFTPCVDGHDWSHPAGLEPAAFCLEEAQCKLLSAASGVAYEQTRHLSRP
jgi:hypothetical protein